MSYRLYADLILYLHVAFIAYVVVGLILILLGKKWAWDWVRNPWFRLSHVLCIGYVVVQSWVGAICPLTVWEMTLREKAGDAVYPGSFIAHWVNALVYIKAPTWVFMLIYTIFGLLVLASWLWVPPRSFRIRQ